MDLIGSPFIVTAFIYKGRPTPFPSDATMADNLFLYEQLVWYSIPSRKIHNCLYAKLYKLNTP